METPGTHTHTHTHTHTDQRRHSITCALRFFSQLTMLRVTTEVERQNRGCTCKGYNYDECSQRSRTSGCFAVQTTSRENLSSPPWCYQAYYHWQMPWCHLDKGRLLKHAMMLWKFPGCLGKEATWAQWFQRRKKKEEYDMLAEEED